MVCICCYIHEFKKFAVKSHYANGVGVSMGNRRSKLEIYLEVLQIINDGTSKPTRIMYNATFSWQPLMRVLKSMISQDLIREIDASSEGRKRDKRTSRLYEITIKGEQVIRYFKEAKDLGLDEAIIPL